ncbi:MAG: hypothetical protein ACRC1R_05640 [Cetobacterium sp.]|uniref:hypothetical protein n=1 Tax=Cetobacterium sp. TaxID=2071632 RepID=UPI003F3DCEA2
MKPFFYITIFLLFLQSLYGQSSTATIDITVTATVVAESDILTVIDNQGKQRNSFQLTHTLDETFSGTQEEAIDFFIQRGNKVNKSFKNISDGSLDLNLDSWETTIERNANNIETAYELKKDKIANPDGTRIKNTIVHRINSPNNIQNLQNELYQKTNSLTITWNKEGFN